MRTLKNEMERNSAFFFGFVPGEKKEDLIPRLGEVKEKGIHNIIASYGEANLQEGKFDELYFATLPEIAEACRDLQMTFWIEDYSPFPTGNANGAYKEGEYEKLNKLYVDERHMDIRGPFENAEIRIDALLRVVYGNALHRFKKVAPNDREKLTVVAYKLNEVNSTNSLVLLEEDSAVCLDTYIQDGKLVWDIPAGYWRIFVVYTTYESAGRPYYMNLLSKESVALQIEKVHKPIYESLKTYSGNCWRGFFYDEPEIGNAGGDGVFDFFLLPG